MVVENFEEVLSGTVLGPLMEIIDLSFILSLLVVLVKAGL
jgi:hypothetical protein